MSFSQWRDSHTSYLLCGISYISNTRSYWIKTHSWHDDVIKWKHYPRYCPFVRGIHKGQWRGAFMFSLICPWINRWVNNREAGDLRRYRAHYDVIVMNELMPMTTCTSATTYGIWDTKGNQISNQVMAVPGGLGSVTLWKSHPLSVKLKYHKTRSPQTTLSNRKKKPLRVCTEHDIHTVVLCAKYQEDVLFQLDFIGFRTNHMFNQMLVPFFINMG